MNKLTSYINENKKKAIALLLLLIVTLGFSFYFFVQKSYVNPDKATISSPEIKGVNISQVVSVPINIDVGTKEINAVQIELSFDTSIVEVQEVTKQGSFIKIWIKDTPIFDNSKGIITFAGGVQRTGFTGKGTVGTVSFKLKKQVSSELAFSPRTKLLLNDGKATPVSYTATPIKIN